MSPFDPAENLRQHRPVLLACEAIGWLHMAGKARMEFLRRHGGDKVDYDDRKWHDAEQPPFPWDDLMGWVKDFSSSAIPQNAWPSSMKEFTEKHREKHRDRDPGILGLLQAGHGVVSGIEKNLPNQTSEYLGQVLPHMWLFSPFGHPKRNLFADPPEVLTERGWELLKGEMKQILEDLKQLAAHNTADISPWADWRERAIGPQSYLRRAFLSTVAETRLPNNDVTLWDQSYVAAALFKSALAGAILNQGFVWNNEDIKQKIRWRLLTVGIGTDHYEARAVKIGDWTGVQAVLDEFFARVAQLIEVDLAAGALLYRDSGVAVFSFPGETFDEELPAPWFDKDKWEQYLQREVDTIAGSLSLETPPLVRLSPPTRSLVPIVRERKEVAKVLAIPVHRPWSVGQQVSGESVGHVCPVCQVRLNGDPTNKGMPCRVCRDRRHHRLEDWLHGRTNYDTIWFEEVADRNNRIALITLSLDLEPWLNGERVDSLRAQAIPEWSRYNPVLSEFWQRDESRRRHETNPVRPFDLMNRLMEEIKGRFYDNVGQLKFREEDLLLANLQEGYRHVRRMNPKDKSEPDNEYEKRLYAIFFRDIVEDRSDAPDWDSLNDDQRAAWFAHQLFRKLPSPGRVYRFWREAQEFFEELLRAFRQIAARSDNPWRTRRLLIKPDTKSSGWRDRALYNGRWRNVPFSLVYVQELDGFVTTSNLARLLGPEEPMTVLRGQEVFLEEEEVFGSTKRLTIGEVSHYPRPHLGVYHPVVPLELSPLRSRVLLPLEAASECVDLALSRWREQFARVWDRLPFHVGVVAFDRTLPFQAVIEATRNLEERLAPREEVWEVERHKMRHGIVALQLRREDGRTTLRSVPVTVADGRKDVFYPYVPVQDQSLHHPLDFRHPRGQVYRHVADLQVGDGVKVFPARVGFLFMDTAATRFQIPDPLYAEDWDEMRDVWQLVECIAPSQAALQRFGNALALLEQSWQDSPGKPLTEIWQDTLRALIVEHLGAKGAALELLTRTGLSGVLQRALEWHLKVLKLSVQGG